MRNDAGLGISRAKTNGKQMKTTKYTFIALLAAASVAVFSPVAMGQNAGNKEKPASTENAAPAARGQRLTPEKRVEQLVKVIPDLTKEQQTKLTELFTKQIEDRAEMRKDGKTPTREETTAATKKFNEKLKEVFSAEQLKKYQEYLKTQAANRGPGNRGNRGNRQNRQNAPQ
jgi:hypothetical protein